MQLDLGGGDEAERQRGRRSARRPVRELIDHGAHQALTLQDCQSARFWYPWHFHPEVEIKVILEGHGTRYVGESIAPFEAGDLCVVGSGTPHAWSSEPVRGKWVRARVVQFLPDTFASHRLEFVEFERLSVFLERAKLGVVLSGAARREAWSELERLFAAKSPTRRLAHLLLFLAIASEPGAAASLGAAVYEAPNVGRGTSSGEELSKGVLAFLDERATSALTQAEVARHFGLSVAGFSKFFTRRFGKPFVRHLAELRVGHASKLLMQEELSMPEVARRSGFGTVASLNRHFRSIKSTTPTAYRQLARRVCRASAGRSAGPCGAPADERTA
jgi:AraC-like DNA-binding protein